MMAAIFSILSRPWVMILTAVGLWGIDELIGGYVMVTVVAIAILAVTTVGIIYWRRERADEEQ